jgi:tRNA threonylcarbamoyladenosine biosynthesis protein TsaB
MSLLLNIDTALETASVCLSDDGKVLQFASNSEQKDHAAWLHVAIKQLLNDAGYAPADLKAVAVSIGPGSYTGLRVGLSAAKGFCYALNIPLITVGTLEMMAYAIKGEDGDLLCPLIDARRMEVYSSVYDQQMTELIQPSAMIIDANSFRELLFNRILIFSGSGRKKLQNVLSHPNARFSDTISTAIHLSGIGTGNFRKQKFTDLAYSEPLYIKDFHSTHKSVL